MRLLWIVIFCPVCAVDATLSQKWITANHPYFWKDIFLSFSSYYVRFSHGRTAESHLFTLHWNVSKDEYYFNNKLYTKKNQYTYFLVNNTRATWGYWGTSFNGSSYCTSLFSPLNSYLGMLCLCIFIEKLPLKIKRSCGEYLGINCTNIDDILCHGACHNII